MRVSRALFVAIACLALLVCCLGCGDDDTVGPAPEETLDRPPIPEPTYYSGPVPEKSMELVVKTVKLSTYIASVDSVWPLPSWCCDGPGCDFQCKFSATYPGPNRMKLVECDTIVSAYDSLFTDIYYMYPSSYGVMACNRLSAPPYIQHVRYWVRLGTVERYSGSTSVTVTRSTTRGVETTKAEEFGRTIGMSATVSGGLFVSFSATLSAEFSYNSSTSITVSEEETVEESFTISCPDNQNIVYCVWQLVDEFRILGPGGDFYEDPNYRFTPGSHLAVCPTAEFVPMTTYFGNE